MDLAETWLSLGGAGGMGWGGHPQHSSPCRYSGMDSRNSPKTNKQFIMYSIEQVKEVLPDEGHPLAPPQKKTLGNYTLTVWASQPLCVNSCQL